MEKNYARSMFFRSVIHLQICSGRPSLCKSTTIIVICQIFMQKVEKKAASRFLFVNFCWECAVC